jgi:hypothetical protein
LLDAWLYPDGRLETVDNDTLLIVDGEPLSAERQLAQVLAPDSSALPEGISRELIIAILMRIGVGRGAGRIWVDRSGRWQNGPLTGHGAKEDAEFIGAAARQRHRQRRMRILAAELTECQREEQRLQHLAEELKAAQQRLENQHQSLPSNEGFRLASTALAADEQCAAEAQHACFDAAKREQAERQQWVGLIEQRNRDAQDMGLSRWSEDPQALIAQLDQYLAALQILQRDSADFFGALRDQADAQDASTQAAESLHLAEQHRAAARRDFEQQRTELETLTRTLGAEAAEITRQIDAAGQRLQAADARRDEHLNQAGEARGRLDIQGGLVAAHGHEIQQTDDRRRAAVQCLQQRAERGLIEAAAYELTMPQAPWNLTQGVDAARLLYHADERQAHDDEAWNRSQASIHALRETLRASLSSFDLAPEPEFLADGLQLVHVPFRGAVLRIDQAAQALAEETAAHERVLSEKERQIFEDFLLGEVGLELHRRMHEAAEQVLRMNREVAGRPMSTGMQMRFRWELADEASPELRAARDVLMRVRETWSSDERATLIAFLQKRIQAEHLGNEVITWRTLLEAALDYRRWHVLHIERRPDQQQPWRLLTRRSYGALSGGEKAVALTVPQCAAASAYYSSADRFAPRLILLDEAFAGVSTDNRSSCLELLVSFDLDVVMTSENERGCYPVVPALAICRLSRAPDLPVVLNDVLLWNGKRQQRVVESPSLDALSNDSSRLATPHAASNGETSSGPNNGRLF